MKVTAILPYFGSKRRMADLIVSYLGKHKAYWEPFCGSLAVLLAKPESSHETVCDLNGDVTNLARVLQSGLCESLYERCYRSVLCEALYLEAVERNKAPLTFHDQHYNPTEQLSRAYYFLVRSWWGRNGMTGIKSKGDSLAVRYTSGGGHGGIRWRSVVESMPYWHERLRSVLVLNRDAFETIGSIADQPGTVIYCDPPYIVKEAKYVHDFAAGDHERLAVLLGKFKRARVVVSYYQHPTLAKLYPGWQVVDCQQTKFLRNGLKGDGAGTSSTAPEVLLINEPALGLFQ